MDIHVLPPERFAELPIPVNPKTSIVVVAEDGEGVQGQWVAQGAVHIEPVQLSDSIRDGGHTAIKMLQTLLAALAANGDPYYYAFADRPEIADYLTRLGLTAMPYQIFMGVNPFLQDLKCPKSESA